MIHLSPESLARWRAEIDLGVEFRDREFGTYRKEAAGQPPTTTLAGRNLDAFEQGARDESFVSPPLNLTFPITKIIVPTLFFQNPRANALPETRSPEGGEDAFYVSELINRDLKDSDFRFKETCQASVFDAFVLGFGVVKMGYATEFGGDVLPTKAEERQRLRDKLKERIQQTLQAVGLAQPTPEEPEPQHVEAEETIRAEHPYLQWVSPFDFVVDPRARDLTDARWIAQRLRRTLAEVKADRRYSHAKYDLIAEAVDDDRVPESFIEDFQSLDIWHVHYKDPESPTGITVLEFAATQTQTKALLHEHNPYDLGGWQYEWLAPNKHGHRLYPVSTLSIVRPLIERVNSSFDAILEQVDKFQAKLVYNERVTPDGEMALDSPTVGARIKVEGRENVRDAVAVISMEQVKSDMVVFVRQTLDLILIIVGVTQAQFTGISTAQTATEAQIGQGGQNIRRTDESNAVAAWTNRVVTKLWRIKAQFQDLTALDLVKEAAVLNPQTGLTGVEWYPPIDEARASRLTASRFLFSMEVNSIQKPNLEVVRQQYESFVRALMEPAVTQGLALEGKRLSASEILRQWSRFFVEYGIGGIERMVVPVSDPGMQQALQQFGQKPAGPNGASAAGSVPNRADLISRVAGEKGQGLGPIA